MQMNKTFDGAHIKSIILDKINNSEKLKDELLNKSIDELIFEIGVYHEELLFQNEELTRAKEETEIIKNRFESLFNKSPVGYAITDNDLRIKLVNKKLLDLTGVADIPVNSKVDKLLSPSSQDTFYLFSKDLKKGTNPEFVKVCILNNNKKVPIKLKAQTYYEKGEFYIRFVFIDISVEEEYLNEIKKSEEKFRLISENTGDGIAIFDQDGNCIYTSPAYEKLFSFLNSYRNKITKQTIYKIIHPEDRDIVFEQINKAIRERKEELVYEFRVLKNNKEYIWREDNTKFIYNQNGKLLRSYVVARDITERKKGEDQLKKLFTAVEQSNVSVVITDYDGNIEYVNPKFEEVTGYKKEEVLGKNPRIIKSGNLSEEHYKHLWDTIKSGNNWIGEFCNKKKNGELFWEKAIITPIKDKNNKIISFIAIKEDITKQKELEESLKKALENAENLYKFKSNLLSNMQHEFGTPLNGILGFAAELSETLENPEQKEMASAILYSAKRLEEMINLVLDMSNLQSVNYQLPLKRTKINDLIKQTVDSFKKVANRKKLIFEVDLINEDVFGNVHPHYFIRALRNILDNAFKFTKYGKVSITTEKYKKEGKTYLKISVADTGIGITKENLEIIWNPFKQVSEGIGRHYEGVGIGLTLAKNVIEQFGGEIYVESEIDKGSTFVILIPCECVYVENETQNIAVTDGKSNHKKLLYVEDDKTNQNIIKMFLNKLYQVDFASSAQEAFKILDTETYDIILLDINLGYGMTGIDICKNLREKEKFDKTPIIAVTAYNSEEDLAKLKEAGFTSQINKPFLRADILKILEQY
jgi:PAS domain S-box-containing protein